MRAVSLAVFCLLSSCEDSEPRTPPADGGHASAEPAPPEPAPATATAAVPETAAAPVDAGPMPPPFKAPRPPRSFGVAPCDQWVRQACACPNPRVAAEVCAHARQKFEDFRVISGDSVARHHLAEKCVDETAELPGVCPALP